MACLYGINRISERVNGYVEGGFIEGSQLQLIFDAREELMDELKNDAIGLLDVELK